MNRKPTIFIFFLVMALLSTAGQAWAGGIKERMYERLPAIKALKAGGVVGENNQGYLTIRNQDTPQKGLIDAENQDRQTIYNAIAKKQGTTPELVGQRRAIQIAEKADSGTWIQDPKGKWRAK
jgi:uncharacterized protein